LIEYILGKEIVYTFEIDICKCVIKAYVSVGKILCHIYGVQAIFREEVSLWNLINIICSKKKNIYFVKKFNWKYYKYKLLIYVV